MKADTIASDAHRIGGGFSVAFTLGPAGFRCDWTPRLPTAAEFRNVEAGYVKARTQFLDELAARLGRPVLCVEVRP